jgi:biopolymer transport protein ExbB
MVMLLGALCIALARPAGAQAPGDRPQPATAPTAAGNASPGAGKPGVGVKLYDKLVQGGWTVGVQLAVSVAGLACVIERFIFLRKARIAPAGLFEYVDALWAQGRFEQIEAVCQQRPSTLSRMIMGLIEHRHGSTADASTVASDIGARELKLHLQKAYPIAVVATIEPLLGLFGTVWGMILAFDKVALIGTMGNAAALSSEIAIALVTTAVGLAIAIPMLALHHYFKSRTAIFAIALEEQVSELISRHMMKRPEMAASG